jgi:hypothetical protein
VPPTILYWAESSPKVPLMELRARLTLSHKALNWASFARKGTRSSGLLLILGRDQAS